MLLVIDYWEVSNLKVRYNMSKNKKIVFEIIISLISVFILVYSLNCFNKYILINLSLITRMILMPIMYWLIAIVPVIICIKNKNKLTDIGFSKNKILKQIIIGIVIAFIMSLLFTLIPILIFGKENTYTGYNFKYIWQYIYQFVYLIFGVSLTEEFIFRGYLLNNFKKINNNQIDSIIKTSLLFGLFHIFIGNIVQVIGTSFIGLIFALCREKIKNCSLLSIIIAHGIYDWLIVLLTSIL